MWFLTVSVLRAVKAALEAERAVAEFGQMIGIEPRRDRAAGRPVGAVSAPDRVAEPPKLRRIDGRRAS